MDVLRETWITISENYSKTLVESLIKRVQAVLKNDGGFRGDTHADVAVVAAERDILFQANRKIITEIV